MQYIIQQSTLGSRGILPDIKLKLSKYLRLCLHSMHGDVGMIFLNQRSTMQVGATTTPYTIFARTGFQTSVWVLCIRC